MCKQTHTQKYIVDTAGCASATPIKAWQSDIHRLVNPINWQDFTAERETDRTRHTDRKTADTKVEMHVRG